MVSGGLDLTISWSTISSQETMMRLLASAAAATLPSAPQYWALPNLSARCTWTMQTSGLAAGTVRIFLPVYGQSMTRNLSSPMKPRFRKRSVAMTPSSTGMKVMPCMPATILAL